jgi:hypothetical protein
MCKYTLISLVSTDCDLRNYNLEAHRYQKYTYWLCRRARGNEPCDRRVPRESVLGVDSGSRQESCPVCEATNQANEKYRLAYQRLEDERDKAIERAKASFAEAAMIAYKTQQDELNNAELVIETVCSSSRKG